MLCVASRSIVISTDLFSLLSPVTCCASVELLYFAYHFYREKHKPVAMKASSIGHMINSDTNVKYMIVHNISFVLLFLVFPLLART